MFCACLCYARKVIVGMTNTSKREFESGFGVFGRKKMITAVVEESMLDSRSWKGIMRFNLGSVMPFDLSKVFKASSFELRKILMKSSIDCLTGSSQRSQTKKE